MKIKHAKFRNTALLFELLTQKITSDAIKNKDSDSLSILKKYFNNTEMLKEYKIYISLSKQRNLSESKANILLETALEAHKKLNYEKLRKEKYNLISEIKEKYDINDFFKAKIENYKTLASICCLLENHISSGNIEDLSKFKFQILENISSSKKSIIDNEVKNEYNELDEVTKNLVFKLMVNKFNDKYKSLNEDQIDLLREYIQNISITPELKEVVNKKINNILLEFRSIYKKIDNKTVKIKIKEIFNISRGILKSNIMSENDISFVLMSFELLKEFQNIDGK